MINVYPKVCIGLPVYNGELFLAESIESLLAQDYPNYEIIISDNASEDKTEEICNVFKRSNSNIRYVRQPENIGPNANFMNLLQLADSKYFFWAACDDLWSPDWISEMVSNFTDADVCLQGEVLLGSKDGSIQGAKRIVLPNLSSNSVIQTFMQNERLWRSIYIYGLYDLNKLKRASLGSIKNDFWAAEAMISKLLNYGSFRCVGKAYFLYRDNPVSQGKSDALKYSSLIRKFVWPIRLNYLIDVLEPQPFWIKSILVVIFPIKQFKVVIEGISRKVFGSHD